jgi:predicted secreted protein
MNVFNIALIFLISWWLAWFLTLPFGVKTADKVELGHASSAPVKPHLKIKAAIATVLAAIFTAIIVVIIESGWIDLSE